MRKFEIVFIIIFIQIGFIITGLVQINNSTFLLTPYINNLFLGSLTNLANSFQTIMAYFNTIGNMQNFLSTQPFSLCIPTTTICSPSINLPAYGFLNFIWAIIQIILSILVLLTSVLALTLLCSAPLYIAIFASLLPQTMGGTTLALTLGTLLWLIQTCIVLWDIFRSIKSISLGAVNTVTWDLDDTASGVLGGQQSYSFKRKS